MSTRVSSPTNSTRLRPYSASGGHRYQIGSYSNVRIVCLLFHVSLVICCCCCCCCRPSSPLQDNHSCFVIVFPVRLFLIRFTLFSSLYFTHAGNFAIDKPSSRWLGSSCFRTTFLPLLALFILVLFLANCLPCVQYLFPSLLYVEAMKTIRWRGSHRFVSCCYQAKPK